MKKIIWASVALLALTSCGAPTIENPSDALQQNQSALIQNVEKLQKLTPEQAKSVGTVSIAMEANEGKANANIGYDFQANQATFETAGTLTMDMNVEANNPTMAEMNMSGEMSLDLITLKNKVLFKLNALNINGADENPQLAMITAMTSPFQNNWYFLENLAENPMMAIQQELLTKQKDVISLMKKHTLLSYISTNENADFYDYEVQLNEESIINFMKDLESLGQTEESTESILTQNEIDEIKSGVTEFNKEIKWNIKIDKSHLEYFILTFTHKDGSVIIENTKNNFNMTMNDSAEEMTMSFLWTKSKTKFDAVISVVWKATKTQTLNMIDGTTTEENSWEIMKLIDGAMSISTNGRKSDMTLNMVINDEYSDEQLKIDITASDSTTAQDVEIVEPSDAKNFEEVIMQMIGPMIWAPMDMEIGYDETDINEDEINTDNVDTENQEETISNNS